MVLGYFLAGGIIYGWGPALASLPGDLLQGQSVPPSACFSTDL